MVLTPLKALLFIGGGILAAGAVAYVSGALDPYIASQPPAAIATAPGDSASQPGETSPAAGEEKAAQQDEAAPSSAPAEQDMAPQAVETETAPADSAAGAMKPSTPEAETQAPAEDESEVGASSPTEQAAEPSHSSADQPVLPTFDVVRIDGSGSLVVAGNAAPGAKVDLLSGELVLGSTMAGPDGAFVFVLDDPLKPGDYQLRLRATAPDSAVVASQQSAVVSVPEKPGGQALAMVEEPGKATEILTAPEPVEQETAAAGRSTQAAPAEGAAPAPAEPAAPVETTAAPEAPPAATDAQPATQEAPASDAPAAPKVAVEAVEIEGSKVFVAGVADPGRKVRAYANEILLGDAQASPDGHFLVEADRDLPVGTYTVRVDALDADGAKVVARATVPFEREPGESIAAVAPEPSESESASASAAPAHEGSQASAQAEPAAEKPADVAAASQGDIPETVSPKLEQADGAVIIRRRDTLWHISRRVYGHGIRYTTIYLANQDQIRDPDLIWPGQVFRVPGKSEQGEPANLDALGDQAAPAPAK